MNTQTISLTALLFVSGAAIAGDYYDDAPYDRYGRPQARYESSTGTKYQYDLNRPSDQNRYEVDTGAQMRDQINVNPMRDLDRSMGQNGGGIKQW